jgi:hypothetical protein
MQNKKAQFVAWSILGYAIPEPSATAKQNVQAHLEKHLSQAQLR